MRTAKDEPGFTLFDTQKILCGLKEFFNLPYGVLRTRYAYKNTNDSILFQKTLKQDGFLNFNLLEVKV